jgi:ribosomal protein S18 acetylase RimI-like enzyme
MVHSIRKAVAADQPWIAKVFDLNKDVLGHVSGGTVFYRWIQSVNPREVWFVIEGKAFVHALVRLDRVAVVYEIAVHPDFKRQGLASALLVPFARRAIELKTDADHAESNAFYRRLGFKLMGFKNAGSGKRLACYWRPACAG